MKETNTPELRSRGDPLVFIRTCINLFSVPILSSNFFMCSNAIFYNPKDKFVHLINDLNLRIHKFTIRLSNIRELKGLIRRSDEDTVRDLRKRDAPDTDCHQRVLRIWTSACACACVWCNKLKEKDYGKRERESKGEETKALLEEERVVKFGIGR